MCVCVCENRVKQEIILKLKHENFDMLVNSIEIGNEDSSLMQILYSGVTLTAVAAVRIGKFGYKILRLWLLWVHSRKRDK